MKIIMIFLIFGLNVAYSNDSLYVISSTITNLDSLRDVQQQNIEWDSITTSTNHFVGENDSWYLLQVIGKESSGSFNVDTITVKDWKENYFDFYWAIVDTCNRLIFYYSFPLYIKSNIPPRTKKKSKDKIATLYEFVNSRDKPNNNEPIQLVPLSEIS